MAKSKTRAKRRRKVSKRSKTPAPVYKGWDGKGGYTKTDSNSVALCFDKDHNYKGTAKELGVTTS